MSGSCFFTRLPIEIIVKILEDDVLSYKDVCSFSSVSTYVRDVAKNNSIWKTKFYQTFTRFKEQDTYNGLKDVDWHSELVKRIEIGNEVRARLDLFGVSCRHRHELSYRQFNPFAWLAEQHPRGTDFIIDELMKIVNDKNKRCNLTRKFYGLKILRFMQQYRLCKVWEQIKSLPEEQQIMEEGALFISQWQYPQVDVIYDDIRQALDNLANDILVVIKEQTGGKHPLCSVSKEKLEMWRNRVLYDNQWKPEHCRQIIAAASKLIFVQKGFKVRRCIYQNLPITNEFSMKECDPLTISVIYEGILRRLGVKCDLISLSCHFLLGWSESYNVGNEEAVPPTYFIDVRNEGLIIKRDGCPALKRLNRQNTPPAHFFRLDTSVKMVQCMASKMLYTCLQNETHTYDHVSRLRSILEMVVVTEPDNFNNYVRLMDFYGINGIETDPALLEKLESFMPRLSPEQRNTVICFMSSQKTLEDNESREDLDVTPKRRNGDSQVKFAIGLVMVHKQYRYKCVVYGWDNKCTASSEWMQTMMIHRLENREYQPFYNVIVEDGSHRYAAQENLRLVDEDYEIGVPGVGRYFVQWCGRYYQPTAMKAAEYPDDAPVREALLNTSPAGE